MTILITHRHLVKQARRCLEKSLMLRCRVTGNRKGERMVEFDDGLAQTLRGAVHARREDAVSLLGELVRVPSVTGAVGAVVGRAFSERGLDVDTWEATREETEPYRDHVGEQISYENRPNVAGTRRGTGTDALSCSTPTPTPWIRATRPRGEGIHSRATWREICSTDAVPAT
jgi:hypothetical protein